MNEQNTIDGWLEWDRYDIIGRGADSVTPLEATVTEDAPEYVGNVSWRSILSENTILNVSYGGYDGYYYLDPNQGYDIAGRYDGATGLYNTNSTYFYLADRTRNQIVASVSHFADDFIKGDHDFKFGMELERSTVRSRYGAPTGVWFYDNYGYYDDPGTEEYDYVPYTQGYYNYSYDLKGTDRAPVALRAGQLADHPDLHGQRRSACRVQPRFGSRRRQHLRQHRRRTPARASPGTSPGTARPS